MRRELSDSRANLDVSRKPKLLLVDENPQDLEDYTAMLRYLGYEVQPAGSYAGAVEFLDRAAYDLVIVDQGSAHFEGRSVLRRAVEVDRRTPVLVLTGAVSTACCVRALDMGADEYVQKPLSSSEVRELVNDYLKPSPYLAVPGENPAGAAAWRKAS